MLIHQLELVFLLSTQCSGGLSAFHGLELTCIPDLAFQQTHPIFSLNWECVVSFLWNTEAACPIRVTMDTDQVRVRSHAPDHAAPAPPARRPSPAPPSLPLLPAWTAGVWKGSRVPRPLPWPTSRPGMRTRTSLLLPRFPASALSLPPSRSPPGLLGAPGRSATRVRGLI